MKAPAGDALVDPELELDEAEISHYGSDTIRALLRRIAPLIGGAGDEAILLVNGKRIAAASMITSFPPEALRKLAILPATAAVRYGYAPGQRVVNLVLKRRFANWGLTSGVSTPTAGGRTSVQATVSRMEVQGDAIYNLQAQYSRDSRLRRKSRSVPSLGTIDRFGYIIDSQNVEPTHRLEIPDKYVAMPPKLGDFSNVTDIRREIDQNEIATLLPETQSLGMNAGITRPVGSFSVSLNANAGVNSSRQTLRFPDAALSLDPDSPWSPFLTSVLIVPGFDKLRPFRSDQSSKTLTISTSLSGALGGWRTNASIALANNWTKSITDQAFDAAAAQARIDAHDLSFNPFAFWRPSMLRSNRMRSDTRSLSAQIVAGKDILQTSAGPISSTITLSGLSNASYYSHRDHQSGARNVEKMNLSSWNGGIALSIPLSGRRNSGKFALGQLGIDLSANFASNSSKLQSQAVGALHWRPLSIFQIDASISVSGDAPAITLTNIPRTEIISRLYDYRSRQVVDTLVINGGGLSTNSGTQRGVNLRAKFQPFGDGRVSVASTFRRDITEGGYVAFPALNADVESNFPDRVIRDAAGRLVSIDLRPMSVKQRRSTILNTTLNIMTIYKSDHKSVGQSANQPLRITTSVKHDWRLQDSILVSKDYSLDQTRGGGLPSHRVSMQIETSIGSSGAALDGSWNGPSWVSGSSEPGTSSRYYYPSFYSFDLSLFTQPFDGASNSRKPIISNLRVSLSIMNLFDSKQKVNYRGSGTPLLQTADEIDPLGRVIQLSLSTRL